jgi:short-subunit dehydrogenase
MRKKPVQNGLFYFRIGFSLPFPLAFVLQNITGKTIKGDTPMDITGKVSIITGASAGIGLATARLFAEKGAKVVMAARSAEKLAIIAAELEAQGSEVLATPTDIRKRDEADRMVRWAQERYGRIDILINNAGQAAAGNVAEVSLEDFRAIMDLNVFGALHAIQAVVPKMREGGGGVIVNVSSMVSKMHLPCLGAYAATKTALNMLSETARVELSAENIRVLTVYPRMTSTDFRKNTLGSVTGNLGLEPYHSATDKKIPVDSPEFVAGKILEAVQREHAEQYMDK